MRRVTGNPEFQRRLYYLAFGFFLPEGKPTGENHVTNSFRHCRNADRTRAPQGRRPRPRARLLLRRPRLRGAAAYGLRRGVHLGGRLPPPHRAQHLGQQGGHPPPPGTTGLFHTAILYPTRPALADALRRLISCRHPARRRQRPRRQRGALPARSRRERRRALSRPPGGRMAARVGRQAVDVHEAAGPGRSVARAANLDPHGEEARHRRRLEPCKPGVTAAILRDARRPLLRMRSRAPRIMISAAAVSSIAMQQ